MHLVIHRYESLVIIINCNNNNKTFGNNYKYFKTTLGLVEPTKLGSINQIISS